MTYFKPPSATLILRKNTFKKHLQKYCFYHRNGMQKITDHCAFSLYIGSLAEILGRQKALLSIAKFNNNRKVAQKYIMSTFALCSLMGCVVRTMHYQSVAGSIPGCGGQFRTLFFRVSQET